MNISSTHNIKLKAMRQHQSNMLQATTRNTNNADNDQIIGSFGLYVGLIIFMLQ